MHFFHIFELIYLHRKIRRKKKFSLTFRDMSHITIMSLNVLYCKNHISFLTLLSLFSYINYSVLTCSIGQTLNKNHFRDLKNQKEVCFPPPTPAICSNTGYCRSWLNTQYPNKVCTLEWIKSVLKLEYSRGLKLKEGKLAWNRYSLLGWEKNN